MGHEKLSTDDSRISVTLEKYKIFNWKVPLISLDVIIGTHESIQNYLFVMCSEIRKWTKIEKSATKLTGHELAIHNYLFYDGKIEAIATPNRMGIFHSIGYSGKISDNYFKQSRNLEGRKDKDTQLRSIESNEKNSLLMTRDNEGFFLNIDG